MQEFREGNISRGKRKTSSREDWFLGHFVRKGHPFHTEAFELKWCDYQKGWKKESSRKDRTKTLLILIRGRFRLTFTETGNSTTLSRKGDFVYYQTKPHIGEALSKCLLFTVRWPSKKS